MYDWFVAGVPRENYSIDLSEWRRYNKTGIVLTTTELIKYQWEEKLQPAIIEAQKNDKNLNKWGDKSYRQKKMAKLANNCRINLNIIY